MKNLSRRLILNLVLFILLIFFLLFSTNIYLNNNHINSNIGQKNVSIIEISIASKTQELVVSLGDLISENMLKQLFKSRINIKSLEMQDIKKVITSYKNFHVHNTSIIAKVNSEDNNNFYEIFEEEKAKSEKMFTNIFLNKTETLLKFDSVFKSILVDTIFSREDFKKFEQFDVVIKNPIFNNCKRFQVSPKLSVNKKNNLNQNQINYSVICLGESDNLDPNKFMVDVSLTPYYVDNFNQQSINFVYLAYVILTFIFGLLLFLLNLNPIKQNFKIKSKN